MVSPEAAASIAAWMVVVTTIAFRPRPSATASAAGNASNASASAAARAFGGPSPEMRARTGGCSPV
jgi:hypothetical protein